MWFNNAVIFQLELDSSIQLVDALIENSLKPCPPHARSIVGWTPICGDDFLQEVAGASLFALGKEERILPRGVIKRFLAERILKLEVEQGRAIKRAEKFRMAEELEFELLPKAFCLQKDLLGMIDTKANRLIVNTASVNQADLFVSQLRKSQPGLTLEPLEYPEQLAERLVEWINNPSSLPTSFQLASDCSLFSPDDEKKRFHCRGYELPAEEVLSLLSRGLIAAEVSLVWQERIQFTLTKEFILKRIKTTEYLANEMNEFKSLEDERQQQDAALMLVSGELRELVNDLLKACQ